MTPPAHKSKSRGWLVAWLLLAGLLLAGCEQASLATPEPVTLTIAGSTEMQPVLLALTNAYQARNPQVLFSLRGGGSRLGEQWVASGRVEIAASTANYPDSALAPGLGRIPIGLDGVALIVHRENPVEALTVAQVRSLYSGRALQWQDVGGEERDVLLVSREDGSATRQLFEERVMGAERVALTAVVMPTSRDVVEYVATHQAAIGYVTAGALGGAPDPPAEGQTVQTLRLEGRLPIGPDVAGQQYPLARALYLLVRTEDVPAVQGFVDFVLGAEGQAIVAEYHIPVRGPVGSPVN